MPGTRRFLIACLSVALLIVIAVPALDGLLSYHTAANAVSEGYAVWRSQDCAGCHTLDGTGAPYAADLTRIYGSRGETDLRAFMAHPDVPHPTLTASDIDDLIAFLQSINAQAGTLPTPVLDLSGG